MDFSHFSMIEANGYCWHSKSASRHGCSPLSRWSQAASRPTTWLTVHDASCPAILKGQEVVMWIMQHHVTALSAHACLSMAGDRMAVQGPTSYHSRPPDCLAVVLMGRASLSIMPFPSARIYYRSHAGSHGGLQHGRGSWHCRKSWHINVKLDTLVQVVGMRPLLDADVAAGGLMTTCWLLSGVSDAIAWRLVLMGIAGTASHQHACFAGPTLQGSKSSAAHHQPVLAGRVCLPAGAWGPYVHHHRRA